MERKLCIIWKVMKLNAKFWKILVKVNYNIFKTINQNLLRGII